MPHTANPKALVDAQLIVIQTNLAALMAYAADRPDLGLPATRQQLVERSGIGRSTVYRLLPESPSDELPPLPNMQQLVALAGAYNLQLSDLTWPGLQPDAPPSQLWQALQRLTNRDSDAGKAGGAMGAHGDAGDNRPRPGQGPKRPK
jgi:hypothetical protein